MLDSKVLSVYDLGLCSYHEAYESQMKAVQNVIHGSPSCLILCEHFPVITLGRLAHNSNVHSSLSGLQEAKISLEQVDRGGDVTLHAPGQLIVYPIINLKEYKKDLHAYMDRLEQVAIDLLREFGIVALRQNGKTGVWVDRRQKIVSLGIGVKQWVTYHGLGINVNTDLKLFAHINPCGLSAQMVSMASMLGETVDMDLVKQGIVKHFERVFESW